MVVRAGGEALAGAAEVALPPFGHSRRLVVLRARIRAVVRTMQRTVHRLFVVANAAVIPLPAGRAGAGAVATNPVSTTLVGTHFLLAPGPVPAWVAHTQPVETLSILRTPIHTQSLTAVRPLIANITFAFFAQFAGAMAGAL